MDVNEQFQQRRAGAPAAEPSSGMKKAVIIGSIVVVVIGLGVAGVLIYRARVLSDTGPSAKPLSEAPSGTAGENGGDPASNGTPEPEPTPPAHVCGDGVCSEGETAERCAFDCGSPEERFEASITGADVTPTSFTIIWETDSPSTGAVSYGTTERYELGTLSSDEAATFQEVPVEGLTPGTTYYVRVQVEEEDGDTWDKGPMFFETPRSSR